MTVAAIIEIGVGGNSEPGQRSVGAKVAGKAQGVERGGALAVTASTSSMPGATSFRSSWQSMLASLNADLKGTSEEEGAADESSAPADRLTAKSAPGNSAAVTLTSQTPSQRSVLESSRQIASWAGEKSLSQSSKGTEIELSKTSIEAVRQATSNPALKSGATVSTRSKEETSGKNTKSDAASGGVAAPSISLPIPAPIVEVQPSSTTEVPPQSPLTDFSGESSAAFTSGLSQLTSSFPGGQGTGGEWSIAAGNQAAGPLKTAAEREGEQSPLSYDPVASTAVESGNSIKAEEAVAQAPAPRGKASAAHAQTAQGAEHGSAQNSNIEVKSSATNGLAATATGEEASASGRMRSQAASSPHPLMDSQSGLPSQSAIQETDGVAVPADSVDVDQSSAINTVAASQSAPVLDTAPTTGKAGQVGSSKATLVKAGSRSSHAAAAVHGDRQGQADQAVQDGASNAGLSRDPSAAHPAADFSEETTGAAGKDGSTVQDTFAALDAESSSGATTWIHAGTRSAEAGFQDPTLGWVGVRADASGGGVHASLVPNSAEAAVTLGGHLAGLNTYLAQQHTPVDSVTLAATEDRSAHSGIGQGAQQSMHQGTGQDTGQGTASSQQSSTQVSASGLTTSASREVSAISGKTETAAQAFFPGGTHISVMA